MICPFCADDDESGPYVDNDPHAGLAKLQHIDETIELGYGPTQLGIHVRIPVWHCAECGHSWTDWMADEIRAQAVEQFFMEHQGHTVLRYSGEE